MTRGCVIYALKKPAYGKFAWNLAVSIKAHSPDIPICVIHDDSALAHLEQWQLDFFTHRIRINDEDLKHGIKFSPGKAKLSGYKYFPFDKNMIIDADSICIAPVENLFDKCTRPFHAQCVGSWDQTADSWTCQWLPLKETKEAFKLPEEYRIYEINSSFMYVEKCEISEKMYAQALENFYTGNNNPKLRTWGGGFPDELAWNVAFAQLGVHPQFDHQNELSTESAEPIFFSTQFSNDWGFIYKNFTFIGYYGDGHFTDQSLQKQYDTLMRGYGAKFGFTHWFKIFHLMKEKHVLTK